MSMLPRVSDQPLPFVSRLFFAYVVFFKVLFDGLFAGRVKALSEGTLALPPAESEEKPKPKAEEPEPEPQPEPEPERAEAAERDLSPALQLLAMLQREGRLVDFLQQDIADFNDADVGTAARLVHEGCRKALKSHLEVEAVRGEDEGDAVKVEDGYDPAAIKLTGNLSGSAPYKGTLRHKGWRAKKLELPELVGDHDASVLAPAEVEI